MGLLESDRPLAFFDLETTGTDPERDKIVEICVLKISPDGSRETKTRRLNPGRPIPRGASAVHGIYDEDVRDEPNFRQVARSLLGFLEGADLAGFNVLRFDVPLLDREFREVGMDLRLSERRIIDSMTIFHRKEPRDLTAAVRFYLDRDHEGAHGAAADVEATAAILEAQLERYEDLPRETEALEAWARGISPDAVDRTGKFVWKDGDVVFAFGKHQDRPLRDVVGEAPDYLEWILGSDFPPEAKEIVSAALQGQYPQSD